MLPAPASLLTDLHGNPGFWPGLLFTSMVAGLLWTRWIAALRAGKAVRVLSAHPGVFGFDADTIHRATRWYVRPHFLPVDPSMLEETRDERAEGGDLFARIDRFLDDRSRAPRQLLILGDSGTGKTALLLNYLAYRARRGPESAANALALVPLGDEHADDLIDAAASRGVDTILLDGLDEDPSAILDYQARMHALAGRCTPFRRVVLTCRTQFFPSVAHIPEETLPPETRLRGLFDSTDYSWRHVFIAPFTDGQIVAFLKLRFGLTHVGRRRKALRVCREIPFLSARPLLLTYITDLVDRLDDDATVLDLYQTIVDAWLERELSWSDPAALERFAVSIAGEIYAGFHLTGRRAVSADRAQALAAASSIDLDAWRPTNRSLLNRDATGAWRFVHRSLLEFFFSRLLSNGDPRAFGPVLSDMVKEFVLARENLSLSPFFLRLFRGQRIAVNPADRSGLNGQPDVLREALRAAIGEHNDRTSAAYDLRDRLLAYTSALPEWLAGQTAAVWDAASALAVSRSIAQRLHIAVGNEFLQIIGHKRMQPYGDAAEIIYCARVFSEHKWLDVHLSPGEVDALVAAFFPFVRTVNAAIEDRASDWVAVLDRLEDRLNVIAAINAIDGGLLRRYGGPVWEEMVRLLEGSGDAGGRAIRFEDFARAHEEDLSRFRIGRALDGWSLLFDWPAASGGVKEPQASGQRKRRRSAGHVEAV